MTFTSLTTLLRVYLKSFSYNVYQQNATSLTRKNYVRHRLLHSIHEPLRSVLPSERLGHLQ